MNGHKRPAQSRAPMMEGLGRKQPCERPLAMCAHAEVMITYFLLPLVGATVMVSLVISTPKGVIFIYLSCCRLCRQCHVHAAGEGKELAKLRQAWMQLFRGIESSASLESSSAIACQDKTRRLHRLTCCSLATASDMKAPQASRGHPYSRTSRVTWPIQPRLSIPLLARSVLLGILHTSRQSCWPYSNKRMARTRQTQAGEVEDTLQPRPS